MTDRSTSQRSGTADRTDIDTFGIAVPPDWTALPLDSHALEASLRRQRTRLVNETHLSPTARRQVELLIRQVRNECMRAKATFAASLTKAIDDGLLSATCTLGTRSRADLGGGLPLTVHTIAAAMSRTPSAAPERGDGDSIVSDLEAPAIVDQPVGRAVKLVRLHRHQPVATKSDPLAIFVQHYLVPFHRGELAAVVTFSSVTPQYARPLSALFEAMMSTFRMFGGDDPTDPTARPNR